MMKTQLNRMQLKGSSVKRLPRSSQVKNDDQQRKNEVEQYEKESYISSSDGSRYRRKSAREDHSWRKDYTSKRSNDWDSDWGPSSSAYTEEKYVPVTIKLMESPEFIKSEEDYYRTKDMAPVVRLVKKKPSLVEEEDHDVQVDDDVAPSPPPPPPKGGALMQWGRDAEGDWVAVPPPLPPPVSTKPPPPPPPMPPVSKHQKDVMNQMSDNDRRNYAKLASLELLTEEDEIPDWALD
eukprot:1354010-Amphidinium_carterae.2